MNTQNEKAAMREILKNLKNGSEYGYFQKCEAYGSTETYDLFTPVLSMQEGLIRYDFFGMRLHTANMMELEWILKNIFKRSAEQFLQEFKRVDFS